MCHTNKYIIYSDGRFWQQEGALLCLRDVRTTHTIKPPNSPPIPMHRGQSRRGRLASSLSFLQLASKTGMNMTDMEMDLAVARLVGGPVVAGVGTRERHANF